MSRSREKRYEYSYVKRIHVLLTSVITLAGALLYFIPDFPLPVGQMGVAILSSAFHLGLFLGFDKATPTVLNLANIANLLMLSASVHFTGGILSPFTMVFALVLISGAGYGVNMRLAVTSAVALYVALILSEKMGLLAPAVLTPAQIYASWSATLFIVLSIVSFMLSTGSIYKVSVNNLRETIERELEIKHSMANRLAKLDAPTQLGLLVQKVVHDVKGSLTAVTTALQLIQQENTLTPDSREDCRVALQELGRITARLSRTLHYVKPGESEREPLCPRDLVETVLSVASFLPAAEGVTIVRNLAPAGVFPILANKEEVQQVFFNVIKNAIEAVPPGQPRRVVEVTLRGVAGKAVVTVSDSGVGFLPAVIQTIGIERFTTKKTGAGIGLIVAREIVESYEGTLSFENNPGGGATVSATFPLYQEPGQVPAPRPPLETALP